MFTLPNRLVGCTTRVGKRRHKKFEKIYPLEEVEGEIQALKESIDMEIKETKSSQKVGMIKLLRTKAVRRALYASTSLLIFQQLVGINTVMYYSPTIVQLGWFCI
ncbi:hypothetical protein ACSQ67_019952 [Phaseolus vulgaris]